MYRPAGRDVAIWTVLIGGPIVYDVWLNRHRPEGMLSPILRWLFRTDTIVGRLVLAGAWGGLTRWLLPHLTRGAGP